jgi:hypothetical protein
MTEPLSQRLLAAADTIEEFCKHLEYSRPDFITWNAKDLRNEAKHVADEEREAVERDTMIEELTNALREANNQITDPFRGIARWLSRWLLENGWTKDSLNTRLRDAALDFDPADGIA